MGARLATSGERVTSIDFLLQNEAGPKPPCDWEADYTDLNMGAGGKYIYMIWKKGEPGLQPIMRVTFMKTPTNSPPHIEGYTAINKDLCAGAGGDFIFAYYMRE